MGKTVLLIEDEQNIIEAVSFILSRDGWEVKIHANGHDAMDAVRARAPDVVILDVMLPGKSGFDILSEIRADARFADLPVLMLSARGQARDLEMARRAGADRYMTKPFSNAEVLDAVRALVPT
ncbi:MAG: response regulator [Rhodobacteraceae bacterium]|jgi:DNA-binding response OmpR family regulator|nr:response regulator [Paracoccaceae bacterium]